MKNIGRNDPCPCGSGKKFKKCHQGREDELHLDGLGDIPVEEMGARIASLPKVSYGRVEEITGNLELETIAGRKVGIKFVDLGSYARLNLFGSGPAQSYEEKKGGLFINPYKTLLADPENTYVAISRDVDDGILIHEIAHVLDYLAGSRLVPGTLDPLAMEHGIPVEHLEHPEEYGFWLDHLQKRFVINLDADDSIILYLFENQQLIKGAEIQSRKGLILKAKSDRILRFLSEHSEEIDRRIRNLPGYIGKRKAEN
jgi:hypothetical protein